MRITKIKIDNFRNFKHVELLFEKCHALVGENGTGKTSVLEAIDLATSSGMPVVNEQDFNNEDAGNIKVEVEFDTPFLVRIPDSYVTQDIPCKSMLFEAHRRDKASPGKLLSDPFVTEKHAIPLIYNDSAQFAVFEENNIPKSVKVTEKGYSALRKSGKEMSFLKNRLSMVNDYVKFPDIFYFDRKRENESKVGFNSLLTKITKDLNWKFRKNINLEELNNKWNVFYESVINTVTDPKKDKIITPIRDKMKNIAGCEFADLELSILDIEQPFSKGFFSKRQKTNQIDSKNLGSGISVLLSYFLLETISAMSGEEIVFLIDEPELHLHPQLQARIFKEFKGSKYQIIYTTQSDSLIDVSEFQSISRFDINSEIKPDSNCLENELEGKKVIEHLKEIKRFHAQKTVFLREDNQILFARKVVLVEGPAEKYGFPIIAEKCDIDLGDITIISCNGKTKIPYYQLLSRTFGVDFFTVFDLDNKDKETDAENKRAISWSENGNVDHFVKSFEELLGTDSSSHKGSETLIVIDKITKDQVPDEIKNILKKISKWSLE